MDNINDMIDSLKGKKKKHNYSSINKCSVTIVKQTVLWFASCFINEKNFNKKFTNFQVNFYPNVDSNFHFDIINTKRTEIPL